ncbi:Flp family type IVb pilin [Pelagibacterium halotolerans]|uniref:Flp family type IVb pilin n=1 Tax=Pelagibacterium halotolerans (strain DSM 22347 / JCM 15775 / CGMCC 1.7692 / B2) TaxID=1082931 RepID=G4RFS0_PELHB|nr:Flp family type IVb pilin [Pelagibacterium halotolerans]AEQ50084.1 hypothetical protein KKY_36 [Pelagibacterium halotolerans B2]QJR19899.1 Flp family type IVb pilin [Pelagibacterium halotolerans]SEA47563.1 pilus assembly protein Flp/PilA [Pelagibacterium halotolerans]
MLLKFVRDETGATAIEYALIASLISIAIIGALILFRGEMVEMYDFISDNIAAALAR